VAIPEVENQMLSALEFLHYMRRFRDSLFVFMCRTSDYCSALLTDFRVLRAAGIKQVIFSTHDDHLVSQVENWNLSGETFTVVDSSLEALKDGSLSMTIRRELGRGLSPLIFLNTLPQSESEWIECDELVVQCAALVQAKKVFFPGPERGLEVNGKFRSYPTTEWLRECLRDGAHFNLPRVRVESIVSVQERFGLDVVLVQGRSGVVYEEVFTHGGSGTLFTQEYPNILRHAVESDVRDIMALMQPYISDGSLKATSEEEVLRMIRSFMVYSVNDQLVAAGTLIEYGKAFELAKLCTLPRFQARGRARELVRALIEEGRSRGKETIFALTVNDYVGAFFERLGFVPVERESLPEDWRKGYDFSRPSKAYQYNLTADIL
jgi:N-acetylglutamate synthase-like GNAT family acetyltransferase